VKEFKELRTAEEIFGVYNENGRQDPLNKKQEWLLNGLRI